jgi:iron complex outermembrane recepter protein
LRGFGIDASYTFIDSSNPGDLSQDIFGNIHNDLPIQGLSRHNANLALLYDYRWWSARLAYNWRSEQLLGSNIGGLNGSYDYFSASTANASDAYCQSPTQSTCQYRKIQLPLYSPAYGQLDFGVTLRPSDHYYVSFQVANLTNEMTRSRQAGYPSGELPRQWWISDRHFNLALGVKF